MIIGDKVDKLYFHHIRSRSRQDPCGVSPLGLLHSPSLNQANHFSMCLTTLYLDLIVQDSYESTHIDNIFTA